jgi:hypothetical protein
MGLGLVETDFKRDQYSIDEQTYDYQKLTPLGKKLHALLSNLNPDQISPFFNIVRAKKDRTLSWQTEIDTERAIEWTNQLEEKNPRLFGLMQLIILRQAVAVTHLLKFILHEKRSNRISREEIVDGSLFSVPFVQEFLEDQGMTLTEKSEALAEHRLPKLIGFLQAVKVASGYGTAEIIIKRLPLIRELLLTVEELMGPIAKEIFVRREAFVKKYLETLKERPTARVETIIETDEEAEDLAKLRILFGGSFLTPAYPIKTYVSVSREVNST